MSGTRERFDKYELIEKIGAGGMAEVYLARSFGAEGLEKTVVIKRILPELSSNARFVEMFVSEAKIAITLNHPNIVQIYDFGKVHGEFYLAMEHVDGWNLGQIIGASQRAKAPIALGDALFILLEVARGLDYAHRRTDSFGQPLGLVHRDISPQNILISREGSVKLTDFGIAQANSHGQEGPGVVKGKFAYMSPEQARGAQVDQRSDLFSLGIVLFEMLTARALFQRKTMHETLDAVQAAEIPPLTALREDVGPALDVLLARLMSVEIDDRTPNARRLQQELAQQLYMCDSFHDSYTLSDYLKRLEPQLQTAQRLPSNRLTRRAEGDGPAGRLESQPTRVVAETPVVSPATGGMVRQPGRPRMFTPGALSAQPARERKEVVVIVGRLEGAEELERLVGAERWAQIVGEYQRMIEAIAFKNDGVMHRVDAEGFVMLLGMPISSENDAARAVRVASDLQEAIAGVNLSLPGGLGLGEGLAIAEVLMERHDDERPLQWSFYEGSEEFARQLARVAMPREILLGGQVWRRVRRDYECARLDGVSVQTPEGVPSAVAWRLVGPRSMDERLQEVRSAKRAHGFYGRQFALKNIRARFKEHARDRRAGVILVRGAQGLGKSTLVEEFLKGLAPREVRVVRGVVNPFDQDVPMGCLALLIAELLQLGSREDLRQLRATIEARMSALTIDADETERALMLHSIASIFGLRYPGALFESLSGDARRQRLSLSLRRLLTKIATQKTLVLAFEDAHYIDALTVELLAQMFASPIDGALVLVLTISPSVYGFNPELWRALSEAPSVHVEELDELAPSDAAALVDELLRREDIQDEPLAQAIARMAGGSPFTLKEVVAVLRDRGALHDPTARARLLQQDSAPEWLPASVEGLISARLDRLELGLRASLQRLALMWSPFSGQEVLDVFDDGEAEAAAALDALDALVTARFLEYAEPVSGVGQDTFEPLSIEPLDRAYRFANELVRQLVAQSLPPDAASAIHLRIATYVSSREREALPHDKALLARHYDAAGQIEQAVACYLEAAAHAMETSGASEAARLADRALARVGPEHPSGLRALILKEQALRELGRSEEHARTLELLAEQVEQRGTPRQRVKVLISVAQRAYERTEFGQALAALASGHELADAHDLPALHIPCWRREASIRLDQGRRDEALSLIDRAIAACEALPEATRDSAEQAWCHNIRGIILRRSGRHDEALSAYHDAERLLASAHDMRLERHIRINKALALVVTGRVEEGLETYTQVLEQVRALGLEKDEASILINMGHAYHLMGADQEAVNHVQRGLYLARRLDVPLLMADGQATLGVMYAERGDHARARLVLDEGLRLAESIPHLYLALHAMLALAALTLDEGGDPRMAIMQAKDSLERAQTASMTWAITEAHVVLGRARAQLGHLDSARAQFEAALEGVAAGDRASEITTLYHAAQFFRQRGEVEVAFQLISRAQEVLEARRDMLREPAHQDGFMQRALHTKIQVLARMLAAAAASSADPFAGTGDALGLSLSESSLVDE